MFLIGFIVGCFITLVCFVPRLIKAEEEARMLEQLSGELVMKFTKVKRAKNINQVREILNENLEVVKWKK